MGKTQINVGVLHLKEGIAPLQGTSFAVRLQPQRPGLLSAQLPHTGHPSPIPAKTEERKNRPRGLFSLLPKGECQAH